MITAVTHLNTTTAVVESVDDTNRGPAATAEALLTTAAAELPGWKLAKLVATYTRPVPSVAALKKEGII